jgi:hypothetical protein
MDVTVRLARPEEQRELTRLCVRATLSAGHDEAFVDRSMPALTITVPFIDANYVQVAQDGSDEVVGVVWVTSTSLPELRCCTAFLSIRRIGSAGSAECFSKRRSVTRGR